jgi:tetratricopeptide (TPR) repeat protein
MHLQLQKDINERSASFNRVIQLLRANYPPPSKLQIAEARNWQSLTKVLPHVLSMLHAFDKSSPSMVGSIEFAQLLSDIGCMDLVARGKIFEAYKLNKKVLEILDTLDTPHQKPLRSDALIIIGNCTDFMALNKREEGLQTRLECVAIREQCYAEIPQDEVTMDDKIRLHNSYTDLACSYQQTNDFDNVRKYAEQCVKQYQTWGPEEEYPYEYAKYYNHMAYVLLYENEGQSALDYARRGYNLVEKASPDTGMASLYQLDYANIAFQVGRHQESILMLKELLESSERDCGRNGVRTLDIRLNIGIVSYMMRDLSYAE